jgi:hypothetical protein
MKTEPSPCAEHSAQTAREAMAGGGTPSTCAWSLLAFGTGLALLEARSVTLFSRATRTEPQGGSVKDEPPSTTCLT